jgi:hypothetical protein
MAKIIYVPFDEYSFDHPNFEDIGGRSTDDAAQLAMTVYGKLRDHFPINMVPAQLAADAVELRTLGEEFKKKAEAFIQRANRVARN